MIAQAIHNSPAFARFVRVHPDAPAYYEWLVSSSERDLDGPGAYLWCTVSFSSADPSTFLTGGGRFDPLEVFVSLSK